MPRPTAAFATAFLAVCAALCVPGLSRAQAYPQRPVTIIVPFSAGGATDLSARLVAQLLSQQLGQQFIVENRVGAGGTIGMGQVAKAAPNGYVLGWGGNSPLTIAPYMAKNPPYDPERALVPVSLAGISSFTLAGRTSLAPRNFAELVALARARPGALTFASTGIGTSGHLLGELFKLSEKIDLLHIPFKGESESVTAMLGDRVDMTWMSTQVAILNINAGRLRGYAVTAASRERAMPDVPTAAEVGVPDLTVELFFGLVAPAGTPAPVVAKLAAAMKQAVADPGYVVAMEKVGMNATSSSPEEFAALLSRHGSRWSSLIKRNGILSE